MQYNGDQHLRLQVFTGQAIGLNLFQQLYPLMSCFAGMLTCVGRTMRV